MEEADLCSDSHKPMMEGCAGTRGMSVGGGVHWGWCQREKDLVTGLKACCMDRDRDSSPGRGTRPCKDRDTEAEVIPAEIQKTFVMHSSGLGDPGEPHP